MDGAGRRILDQTGAFVWNGGHGRVFVLHRIGNRTGRHQRTVTSGRARRRLE